MRLTPKSFLILCLAVMSLGFFSPGKVSAIEVELTLPRTNYFVGEKIDFYIRTTNSGVLNFSTSAQTFFTLDNGSYESLSTASQVFTQMPIPHTWTNSHAADNWTTYPLTPGAHQVYGTIFGYGSSLAKTFWIQPPPPATGNFLINFTHLIGTNVPIVSLAAYAACGIRFTNSGGFILIHNTSLGSRAIRATFDRPVFGATVKVAGNSGVQITLTARNHSGQIISAATCPTITQSVQFAQSLAVEAAEPIATLEWTSTATNTTLYIDDLFVITGPILRHRQFGNTLRLTWPTVTNGVYQLWSSTNLQTWIPEGSSQSSLTDGLTNDLILPGNDQRYFRVSQEN